ncbi:hypothetical protein LQZ19_17115 [Treponema primitia]|uniref:hypothetical protein n=1 Tax=Treponema primitia TaxID=88058 RepID=UPI00397FA11B
MYKRFVFVLLVLGFCFGLYAQEEKVNRFSWSMGYNFSPSTNGIAASTDFGFLIFHNEELDIRNQLGLNSLTLNDNDDLTNTAYTFTEKFSFGKITANKLFRYYSFLEGGIGIYSNDSKKLFETPIAYNFGLGIGLDIFVEKNFSFFFEWGFLEHILDKQDIFDPRFQMGIRLFF